MYSIKINLISLVIPLSNFVFKTPQSCGVSLTQLENKGNIMNTVATFTSRSNKRQQIIEDLGSLPESVTFGTYTLPLFYDDMKTEGTGMSKYHKRVLLMNDHTNEPLSIVGRNYKNTDSHADQFGYMEDMIVNSTLNLEGLSREISVSHGGGRAYARYRFPAHTVQTGEGDETVMEMVGRNSFDGSWPSIFELGAWRMICCNLQVIGTVTAVSRRRHTKHSNIEGAVAELGNCLESFMKEGELWNQYRQVTVSDKQAFQVLATLSENRHAIAGIDTVNNSPFDTASNILEMLDKATKTKNGHERKKSSLKTLWNLYKQEYSPSLGSNLLALYNTMTDWSTHHQNMRESKSPHTISSLQVQASEKVRKVIQTQPVFRIAA